MIEHDAISRQALKRRLDVNYKALRKSNKSTLIESTMHIINTQPTVEINDEKKCLACVVSSPVRKWHKLSDAMPKPLETVLGKLTNGDYAIVKYNNGGWLGEANGMWISGFQVEEWKAIE